MALNEEFEYLRTHHVHVLYADWRQSFFFFLKNQEPEAPTAKDLYLKKTRIQLYKGKEQSYRGAELQSYRGFRGPRKKEKKSKFLQKGVYPWL